jgi:hypothetical protein
MPESISVSFMSAVARPAGHKKSNNRKVKADLNIPTFPFPSSLARRSRDAKAAVFCHL